MNTCSVEYADLSRMVLIQHTAPVKKLVEKPLICPILTAPKKRTPLEAVHGVQASIYAEKNGIGSGASSNTAKSIAVAHEKLNR